MPCALIHVGLPKAGSSTLKAVFKSLDGTSAVDLPQGRKILREHAVRPTIVPTSIDGLTINPPSSSGRTVISDEGLVWAYVNDPKKQFALPKYQEMAARLLGRQGLGENLLIMVRDPLAWIRSAHGQAIKEGGTERAQDFVDHQSQLISSVLNLRHLLDCWGVYFNITIRTMEELGRSPVDFILSLAPVMGESWDRPYLEARLRNTRISNAGVGDRLALLARLNELNLNISAAFMSVRNEIPESPVNETTENQVRDRQLWVNRRLIEHAADAHIAQIEELVAPLPQETFHEFVLPHWMKDHIARNYLDVLADWPEFPDDLVTTWERSLREHP